VVARDHGNTFERCSVDYGAVTVYGATELASKGWDCEVTYCNS
jgi:hypothetical protein